VSRAIALNEEFNDALAIRGGPKNAEGPLSQPGDGLRCLGVFRTAQHSLQEAYPGVEGISLVSEPWRPWCGSAPLRRRRRGRTCQAAPGSPPRAPLRPPSFSRRSDICWPWCVDFNHLRHGPLSCCSSLIPTAATRLPLCSLCMVGICSLLVCRRTIGSPWRLAQGCVMAAPRWSWPVTTISTHSSPAGLR